MKRILVTGAAGFVGANLARRLLQEGEEVHLLVRPESRLWRLADVAADFRLHYGDLRDETAVTKAVQAVKPEWIFHLAVYGAYSYQTDVNRILQTNIMGTSHLVQACAKTDFETFVNTGSSSEYGFTDHPPAETEALQPNSYYATAKAACTLYCCYSSKVLQRPITTLRLYSVYGAYEEPTRLMPTLIKQGLAGRLPPLVAPETARDFIDIDDVVEVYLQVARSQKLALGEVFNVGTGVQHTLRDVVEIAREVLNIPQEPNWGTMENRIWDTSVWVANTAHLREVLGWQPQIDLRRGFTKMVAWFKEHQHFYQD